MTQRDDVAFGVNYTPRRGWFHAWLDLDLGEVRDDLQAIAGLGIDHVRIFPLWPLLQPNRSLIRGVDDVVRVAQTAVDAGLAVSVDVLQGHLSSFDFLPSWVSTWHRRSLFTDPDVVAGHRALVAALGVALREVPGATGLCVGNEFPQFAAARHPDADRITGREAAEWLDALLTEARAVWPGARHVFSFDDDLFFDDTHPFTPEHAVTRGDATTVHAWIFGSVGRRYGRDAVQSPWFVRWLAELAAAWGPGRPVWLQEVGAPLSHLSPDRAPAFVTDTIDVLLGGRGGGRTPGLDAITWWCSHDVARDLADFPELEHTLGLFDADGRVKPTGEAYAAAIARWRGSAPAEEADRDAVDVTVAHDFADRSATSAEGEAFARWCAAALEGDVRAVRVGRSRPASVDAYATPRRDP